MRWSVGLAAALALAAVGCGGTSNQTYPADPLFINKKPIETRVENAAPVLVVQLEPAVPAVPAMVLAAVGPNQPRQVFRPPTGGPLPRPPTPLRLPEDPDSR